MKIKRLDGGGLRFSRVSGEQMRLFGQIAVHADTIGTPEAEERLFQPLMAQPRTAKDDQANDDWQDTIVPDLRESFNRDLETVQADLRQARVDSGEDGPVFSFIVGEDHIQAWYSALNQARLVMQERYRFPESDSAEALIELLQSANLKPFLTSRFYVEIQAALLELAMDF